MEIQVHINKDGFISNPAAIQSIKALDPGHYLFQIVPLLPKTAKDKRSLFFYKIGILAKFSGVDKQEIYATFKDQQNITSTKDCSSEQWDAIEDLLTEWAYKTFDIIV